MQILFIIIIILCGAINIPFIIYDQSRWWNAASMGFCFGVALDMIFRHAMS